MRTLSTDLGFARTDFPVFGAQAAVRIDEGARTRGHAAGYVAGLAAANLEAVRRAEATAARAAEAEQNARESVERAVEALRFAAYSFDARVMPVVESVHSSLLAAAIDIAEAILGVELSDTATSARAAVTRALADVDPLTVRRVRLNPSDAARLDDTQRAALGVEIVADTFLAQGDAMTEFEEGILDARLGTAVARVRAALGELS